MLTVQKSKSHKGKCVPNILPCRINHNGPVDASKRYWNPTSRNDKTVSYFRGRKLYARNLKVPKGYRGVVLLKTERVLPHTSKGVEEEGEEEEDMEVEVKIVEEESTFEEIMVWGHEAVMDKDDPYVRGVEEWIGFAESIHSYDASEADSEGTKE